MPTTLRDALADAAGPAAALPPEHEIERRSRRLRRNSRLLEGGAVAAAVLVLFAVLARPGDDAPSVRTIGAATQEGETATGGRRATDGDRAATTTTAEIRSIVGEAATSVPTVTVTVPGSPVPAPPPGFVGPPPRGTRLAFAHGTTIETMRPDGTDRRVLLDDGRTFRWLGGWSPKRDRLAVIVRTSEKSTLAILEVETGTSTTVVDRTDIVIESADWSPDGTWLAYSARPAVAGSHPSTWLNLRLVRPDGTDDHELPVRACRPAWAPDSKRLAAASCGGSGAELDLVIVEVDGSRVTTLPGMHMAHVSWSPDGKWLAGSRFKESAGTYEPRPVIVFRPDGSDVRTLPTGTAGMYRVAWTTDSARLVYASTPPSRFDGPCGVPTAPPCDTRTYGLYSVAFDGSDELRLTEGLSQPVMPWR